MKQGILRLALLICTICLFTGLEAGAYTRCPNAKAEPAPKQAAVKVSKAVGFELSPLETFLLNI